ncbi:cytochrome b5-like heme/steroid binding domain-containing protein [Limtongia smithiae]|uniref:cytochrome b5-like heme/steroid binding domain-containing protein n=1 Tax=Limtongia smithiae TaxID=1125753 RepID=UPI0034CD666B
MAPRFAPKEPVVLDPPKEEVFTFTELAQYNGVEHPSIYVAVKGIVFDVTKKAEVYGPGKSYSVFAGKDGSRGLAKSSLKLEDAVPQIDGLTDSELVVLDDWFSYFSQRYNVMGTIADSMAKI